MTDAMAMLGVQSRETLGNCPDAKLRTGRWIERASENFRKTVDDRRANFDASVVEQDQQWISFEVIEVRQQRPLTTSQRLRVSVARALLRLLGVQGPEPLGPRSPVPATEV